MTNNKLLKNHLFKGVTSRQRRAGASQDGQNFFDKLGNLEGVGFVLEGPIGVINYDFKKDKLGE